MQKIKTILKLFCTMFKIGLFTFGGGYAMIAIIERDVVEKKQWIAHDEFLDMIAIAESTPGPLAINSATYIGYKIGGVLGSIFATLGVVLPSFIIIFVISLFFDKFLQLQYVQYAFKGIRACVAFIIVTAGFKMMKKLKKTALNIVLLCLSLCTMLALSLFAIDFSSIFLILIGGAVGLSVYLITLCAKKNKSKNNQALENKEDNQEKGGNE